jgi:AdoMet-dependent heme synthase
MCSSVTYTDVDRRREIIFPALGPRASFLYDRAPMLVYWESTRACDLACVHCRAEATTWRSPLELRTEEVRDLLGQIAAFGERPPHLVITGGDPLQRPDLFELIAHGRALGLPVSVTPAGTARLTAEVIGRFKDAGVNALGLSLDGSDAARHDAFRGEPGSFAWTVAGIRRAVEQDLPVQVNTMVTARTVEDIPGIYDVLRALGIPRWALFFLISTGRGATLRGITAEESELFLNRLWRLVPDAPFPIKTTEAHHYRRIAFMNMHRRGLSAAEITRTPVGRGFGIRDGNGVVFVSHTGAVYPSGFLPLSAGNVRRQSLVDIYRDSRLFRQLRDVDQLQGKCRRCEFRALCGGSRARAYAETGDPMAADALCLYEPRGFATGVGARKESAEA